MDYTKIKSSFIKAEIKKTQWKDRSYIDDLMKIERLALGKHFGLWSGYIIKDLEDKYPVQWKKIWLELDPEGYKKALAKEKTEKQREAKEDGALQEEERKEIQRAKESWRRMGGKVS